MQEGEDPETAPQDCVPVQRSQGGNFQALLDEAGKHDCHPLRQLEVNIHWDGCSCKKGQEI